MLYIVLFLHQTTTSPGGNSRLLCCISYYSYIKPQPINNYRRINEVVYRTIPTSNHNSLIEYVTLEGVVYRTIPTSNHNPKYMRKLWFWLYIVLFLHQTTTNFKVMILCLRCISYYSYIKPQPREGAPPELVVVYRTIPTSNHNRSNNLCKFYTVVYRTIPTSNHNHKCIQCQLTRLYIVLFLHQTTTSSDSIHKVIKLYIVLFLHQTTT